MLTFWAAVEDLWYKNVYISIHIAISFLSKGIVWVFDLEMCL